MRARRRRRSAALPAPAVPAALARWLDDRLRLATPLRSAMNKVFPDHWSFLLGEIALYSFIVLLLTGTVLALFFDPSPAEVVYHGSYAPLNGVGMSRAYESSLNLSFEVRGGLLLRQSHHWAALLFMAAIVAHLLRIFFTGAFRRPRELNWVVGLLLFWLGFLEGFAGYSLPDDALSGTGLRIAHAIVLSIPVAGTWIATSLFGGEFPGAAILTRLYIVHVWIVPAFLLALIAVHLAMVVRQKHTQWPGPGRTEHNVVGTRLFPGFALRSVGFLVLVLAVLALLAGLFQINPVWLYGPYRASVVSAASQPDWYVWFLDGALRLFPPWELRFGRYSIPPVFWPGVILPAVLTVLAVGYPWWEQRGTTDPRPHHLVQRPRDAPVRTGIGAMAVAFYAVLSLSAANDVIADKLRISLNAATWAGRIGLMVLPPLAYYLAHRAALGLQQHDREVLAHGMETGILRRTIDGRFDEVHQPLAEPDRHGHIPLDYAGWTVPKKMNRVGALLPAVRGFFFPVEQPTPPAPTDDHNRPGHPDRPDRQPEQDPQNTRR